MERDDRRSSHEAMRILADIHSLEIGGLQLTALDLAGAMRALGHKVLVFGPPGPLADLARRCGLEVVLHSAQRGRPSLGVSWSLRRVIRTWSPDLIHAYSHSASLEAFLGAYVLQGVPLICSVMGTSLPWPFPRSVPLVVGKPLLVEKAIRANGGRVHLIRPPIDTELDHPPVDPSGFMQTYGLGGARLNVVLVSRLAAHLKLEGLERAIDAVASLAAELPVRLIIVGGGSAYDRLRERAEARNEGLGDRVIVMTGPLLDPRPAYAAADVVLGMGTSVLRGMAFSKPAIVLGEQGFSEVVGPSTIGRFLTGGFYGLGDGIADAQLLTRQLRTLVTDSSLRAELGAFSRGVVCDNFSITSAAAALDRLYRETANEQTTTVRRLLRAADFVGMITVGKLRRKLNGETIDAAA